MLGDCKTVPDEQEQYDTLYRTHRARIVRLCRLLLKDPAEADEVAQEVFLKLFQASTAHNPPVVWEAWLTQVAVNACRDRRRSRWWKWWEGKHMEFAERTFPSPAPTPEEALESREECERIWRVFKTLSPRQQEVFVLRYVEEWRGEDVAELLGLTPGSVKRHLFLAVHKLRKALGESS
jgi:RNA polymerase sigma-70 factor (ECF subfamily)